MANWKVNRWSTNLAFTWKNRNHGNLRPQANLLSTTDLCYQCDKVWQLHFRHVPWEQLALTMAHSTGILQNMAVGKWLISLLIMIHGNEMNWMEHNTPLQVIPKVKFWNKTWVSEVLRRGKASEMMFMLLWRHRDAHICHIFFTINIDQFHIPLDLGFNFCLGMDIYIYFPVLKW
jgi:hypothetical protein